MHRTVAMAKKLLNSSHLCPPPKSVFLCAPSGSCRERVAVKEGDDDNGVVDIVGVTTSVAGDIVVCVTTIYVVDCCTTVQV